MIVARKQEALEAVPSKFQREVLVPLAALLVMIAGPALLAGCTDEAEAFTGLYVEESWLHGLEEDPVAPELLHAFNIPVPWTPKDWHKVEILPDLILVDDGRIEIDNFEISHGKLLFKTWTLRGVAEHIAGTETHLSITITHRLSGDQESYAYLRLTALQLNRAIESAISKSKKLSNAGVSQSDD